MHSNAATFRFALMVTLVCSLLLAAAATLLKPRQSENVKLDIKKNILSSVGIKPEEGRSSFSRDEIQKLYAEYIREYVVDTEGNLREGLNPNEVDQKKTPELLPLYEYEKDGQVLAYVIPISGKGLWSTIYGYLALEPDLNTIKGITFYQHGETPGLGGEIDKEWFISNYVGKRILDDNGNLVSVTVVRGKVEDRIPEDRQQHYVDGISGATITGRGVEQFMREDLKTYQPFFDKIRNSTKGEVHG